MDIDEDQTVPTSDQDELEELAAATSTDYWLANTRDLSRRRALLRLASSRHKPEGTGNPAQERSPSNHARSNASPPRKRRKVDSLLPCGDITPHIPRPNSPESAASSHAIARLQSPGSHIAIPSSSPTSYIVDSPMRSPYAQRNPSPRPNGVHVDQPSDVSVGQGGVGEEESQRARQASTGSPSPSPDPLLLFTPPPPRLDEQLAMSSPASSPLTPASSPPKATQSRPSSPMRSSPQPPVLQPSARSLSPASQLVMEQVHAARYSLRTRNLRQLKPYAYDKIVYNRSMASNPEAIVKLTSPQRRRRSTSAAPRERLSDADDEYQGGDEELDEDEHGVRRRRKGKGKEVDSVRGEDGDDPPPRQPTPWLPEVFNQSSSSSSGDEADKLFRQAKRQEKKIEKERRKKKLKAFPMKKQDFRPSDTSHPISPSPAHEPGPSRSRPRPRPRKLVDQPVAAQPPVNNGSGDEEEPAPNWRRRRSVAFISPAHSGPGSPPSAHNSPGNAYDAMDDWDDNFPMYEDEFARGQSPLKLLPTQHDAMSVDSSEAHDPPPTSSEPNEIIDLTSGSEGATRPPLPSSVRARSRSRSGSGSGSSSDSMDSVDRRRLQALKRMMPAVMIKRLEKQTEKKKRASAERDHEHDSSSAGDSGTDDAGRPLRPGESRKRIRKTISSRSIEIRGDSESSDVEIPMSPGLGGAKGLDVPAHAQESSEETGLASSDESIIEPIRHQPRPKPHARAADALDMAADEGRPSSSSSDDDGFTSGRGYSPARVPKIRGLRYDGEAEVDNSIDRMLARTDYNRPRVKRKRRRGGARRGGAGRERGHGGGQTERGNGVARHHSEQEHRSHNTTKGRSGGHDHGAHASGSGNGQHGGKRGEGSGLRITTSGAKRYGPGRQMLLPFHRLPSVDADDDLQNIEPVPLPPNEVHFTGEESAKAKQKAAKLKGKMAGVYTFGSGASRLVGAGVNAGHVTIDQEVAAPRGPPLRDVSRSRPPASKSGPRRHNSRNLQGTTLEDYWAPQDYEDDSFVVQERVVSQRLSQQHRELDQLRRVTVDLDIHPLPAGIAFPNNSYLGHGWLHELVNLLSGTHGIPLPPSCSMFDCYLHSAMSVADFTAILESVSDRLRNLILGGPGPADADTCQKWQMFLHAVSQHVSWLLANVTDGERTGLASDIESFVRRMASLMDEPAEIWQDDDTPNPLVLQVLWSLLEISSRLAVDCRRRSEEPDRNLLVTVTQALMTRLWDLTFGCTAIALDLSQDGLTTSSVPQQISELWVCVLNITNDSTFQDSLLPPGTSFWSLYLQLLHTKGLQEQRTDLKTREAIWKSVFTLCALSQFSIHGNSSMTPRLPPSWFTITSILERAPLSYDTKADEGLSRRIVRKRDEYVRVLVCRCLWLNLKWHWRLDLGDAPLVFNRLIDVFKSRRFASLADEQSDFPSFLRHNNLALLQEKKSSDTAFTLFLKLVVRAAEDVRKNDPKFAQSTAIPPMLKKILSLAVPVGSVPFTKEKPPTTHELSMLYNRFSVIAVTIYLEPTERNLVHRLGTARRYVNFQEADIETRRACIRGAMHLAILLQHLRLPLTEVLAWMEDMTNTLIDEFKRSDAAKTPALEPRVTDSAATSVQLLLGCVRMILETSSMDHERPQPRYPDPALLQGAWVTRVFSTETRLSTTSSTGDEIRRLVQAFLDTRSRVIPPPRRPQPSVPVEDSEESQEYYGPFEFDVNDVEFMEALGIDNMSPEQQEMKENKEKDKIVCDVILQHISPAIYRLVCKHFSQDIYRQAGEPPFRIADKWVDCWVGCASVVVQNGRQKWEHFLAYGPQSWEQIIELDWRRRVGLRFMYKVLQLDPQTYTDKADGLMDRFIDVLLESMATPSVTIEHEYASLLFSIDKLHHPLLRGLPIGPPGHDGDFHLNKNDFSEGKRLDMLDVMFKNLSENLKAESRGDTTLTYNNNKYLSSITGLLVTMQGICNSLASNSRQRASYIAFCKQVPDLFSRYPVLCHHTRLEQLVTSLCTLS